MKTPIHPRSARWCSKLILPTLVAALWLPTQGDAAQLFWDPIAGNNQLDGGSGSWNADSSNILWTTSLAATSSTYWTSGSTTQAVFGGPSAADGSYVINVSSSGIQASGVRFISSGYILSATTSTTITAGYGGVSVLTVAPGVTATIGDNITVASIAGQAATLSNTTATVTGTIIIQGSSPSAVATVKAQSNNNTVIADGINVVVGQNGVLQTALTTNGGTGNGNMVLGSNASDATLTVNGGMVNFGTLVMANAAASGVATLTINSGNVSTAASNGALRFGGTSTASTAGTAIVNLNGGTLGLSGIYIGKAGSAQYNINFNGGVLQVTGSSASAPTYLASSSQIMASVMGRGAIIDTNGNNATIGQALVSGTTNDGGLTKEGAGTLTLAGVNTYTGATTIKSGSLALGAASNISNMLVLGGIGGLTGTLDVSLKGASYTQASISGNGSIVTSGGTVTATGNVTPGFSAGSLNVSGNFTLAGTATTQMEIAGNGGVAGIDFDRITANGILTYGGALTISSYNGYDLTKASSYDLFDFASKSGDFSSVTVNSVLLSKNGNIWSDASSAYSFDETSGVLSVTLVPEPATYAMILSGLGMLGLLRRKIRA